MYGSEILSKNWDIWNPKFQQNSIVYYFFFIFLAFLAFCFLFHVPKHVQKLWHFLSCFTGRDRDFTNDFWKILKVLFKKILICEIFFFLKIMWFTICFFIFYYFWHFIFNFVYLYLLKKCLKFLCFFILWIIDFVIEFWKILEFLLKKYKTFL